ncbi:hypothetical protein E6Q11_06655 [Candidatus Dojkabacteria bacterium]|uniref:Uncharacterized protein n=1 Tax=Candidatus Dojkabacteria bacterium TaxID=2099670 RepID=A0A5C7J2R0_9BACT|nr:MAG: hypothetical protein E6Q11_06655 [Candidatus Dojkabacteria bacterium]
MSKTRKIKTYEIVYSLLGSGSISIEASNISEAKKLFEEMDVEDLIEAASFNDSCEIEDIN